VPAVLADATAQLASAGVASPRVDAELLLAHALWVPRSRLLLVDEVPPEAATRFATALARRLAREPLQHITGTAPFRRLEIQVGPGAFVPRPETELLVDAVLPVLRAARAPVAVDLCSGTGALAVALADEAPRTHVVAVERPGAAEPWLQRNTAGTRVEVVIADVTVEATDAAGVGHLLAGLQGSVDAVVSNPPYVPSCAQVDPEVRADPAVAVFAGADGLDLMPHVIARAAELLRPGGVLAVEHDDSQRASVPALVAADGRFTDVGDHDDLAGRPRYSTAVRR
jgi:release factor glutamine methyltransferase